MVKLHTLIKQVSIEKIKPYGNNAKKHTDEQIDKIAASIKEFGFVQPLVITEEKEVVIGHGRLQAAIRLGMNEVPVIEVKDLSPEQIRALRIADNRVHMDTLWEMDKLAEELKALNGNFDMTLLGFEKDELLALLSGSNIQGDDRWKLWNDSNMPDFISNDVGPYRTILVHFENDGDIRKFAEIIGQTITEKTKYLYYPEQKKDEVKDLRYEGKADE